MTEKQKAMESRDTSQHDEIWRYRVTHQDVYNGISQRAAAVMIEEDFPEFGVLAAQMLKDGEDVRHFLSVLDSFA